MECNDKFTDALEELQDAGEDENSEDPNDDEDNDEEGEGGESVDGLFYAKDMQQAINAQHPFGLKIWKPALYKKNRSIEFMAYADLHSSPDQDSGKKLYFSIGNIVWTVMFSWWIAALYLVIALGVLGPISAIGHVGCACFTSRSSNNHYTILDLFYHLTNAVHWVFHGMRETWAYAKILLNLSSYILWPFGKFVAKKRLPHPVFGGPETPDIHHYDTVISMDPGHLVHFERDAPLSAGSHTKSHNTEESEQLCDNDGMSVTSLLLPNEYNESHIRSSYFHRYTPSWILRLYASGLSGLIFFVIYTLILAPIHLLASGIGFFTVFSVPIARLNFVLLKHVLRHPLRLSAYTITEMKNSFDAPAFVRAHARAQNRGNDTHKVDTVVTQVSLGASARSLFNTQLDAMSFRPYSIAVSDTSDFAASNQNQPPAVHETLSGVEQHMLLVNPQEGQTEYVIILSIRYAMGLKYYKYTVDGIGIVFINFLGIVFFTLFGTAVAAITAQTGSLALGAVINATFGSIVEVLLYVLALREGKERMVEGSIIGSFLCGILALPGAAMFSGGLVRKEQRFNAKSAGVSSTMMIMALIGAFTPTLFQQIYGSFELRCDGCPSTPTTDSSQHFLSFNCKSCQYVQPHATQDPVYISSTKPLMYLCASVLILVYAIGLLFTLRTHSKQIYATTSKGEIREKILKETIRKQIVKHQRQQTAEDIKAYGKQKVGENSTQRSRQSSAFKREGTHSPALRAQKLKQRPHSVAVSGLGMSNGNSQMHGLPALFKTELSSEGLAPTASEADEVSSIESLDSDLEPKKDKMGSSHGDNGHGAPNWGAMKSSIVLLLSTVLFSAIAEVLIDSVDDLLKTHKEIDEKFLGLTLFALIPSVTEFYNAIAFAMQGNIVLALEIGSAYTIQVALLQIPALVAYSAWSHAQIGGGNADINSIAENATRYPGRFYASMYRSVESYIYPTDIPASFVEMSGKAAASPFTLIFPRWDVYSVLFATFLLSYIYIEGKSNYFKGSMLLLAYFVLISAFWFAPVNSVA